MRIGVNGVHLNVEHLMPENRDSHEGFPHAGLPLVLLHGFTGSSATWHPFTRTFGRRFRTVAVDLLGHGSSDSPPDAERYRMERCLEDLLALFERLELERVNLLGYSMGGRVALNLALAAPERIDALVLESASPGIGQARDRDARVRSDAELADLIEREGLETFVDRWERQPLFASQSRVDPGIRAELRAQRLRATPVGLANSLRGLGTGMQEPLWERLSDVHQPVLLIAGELDLKYCEIARLMAVRLPNERLVVVPGAGHAVHLEQPHAFAHHVLRFLSATPAEGEELGARGTKEREVCP